MDIYRLTVYAKGDFHPITFLYRDPRRKVLSLMMCTGTAVPSPTTPLNPSFGWIPLRQLSRPFEAVFRRSTWVEEAFSIERNPFDRGQKKITQNAKKKPHTRALLSGTPTFLGFVDGESFVVCFLVSSKCEEQLDSSSVLLAPRNLDLQPFSDSPQRATPR